MEQEILDRFELAKKLATGASDLILPLFQGSFAVNLKDNGTFVTEADQKVEETIRDSIEEAYPQDGIIGEEFPDRDKKGELSWTIDPIDGTSSFVHGVPLFGTMVGLMQKDEPIFGVIHFPALGETFYALKGEGSFVQFSDGSVQKISVRNRSNLAECTFSHSGREYFQMADLEKSLCQIQNACALERGWGDCYGHMLVASGKIDLMVDALLHIWDIVPVKIIVEEAGGLFYGFDGRDTARIPNGISSGPDLKELVLGAMA